MEISIPANHVQRQTSFGNCASLRNRISPIVCCRRFQQVLRLILSDEALIAPALTELSAKHPNVQLGSYPVSSNTFVPLPCTAGRLSWSSRLWQSTTQTVCRDLSVCMHGASNVSCYTHQVRLGSSEWMCIKWCVLSSAFTVDELKGEVGVAVHLFDASSLCQDHDIYTMIF